MSENRQDDEIEQRDEKGRFRKGVSGCVTGRPKGKTSKINKQKLTAHFNKNTIHSLQRILELSEQAAAAGNIASAMRGFSFYAGEGLRLLANQEKLANDLLKAAPKDSEEDNETVEVDEVVFSITNFKAANAE